MFEFINVVFRRPFQISRSSEKANAAAVLDRFAEGDAVKAVAPQQPRFLFLYGFGNAVFDLCQVEIGVLEVAPREQTFFVLFLDKVGGFVCDHDFGVELGNEQHFVDGFLFCNCLISSSAIKIFSSMFFIFCFPFFLFFCKEKTVTLFLIYCFSVSLFLNFNYLSHL